jgi:hypothetical protein
LTSLVSAVTILPVIVTKLVDTLRNAVDPDAKVYKVWWNIAALAIGIALAIIFKINAIASISSTPLQGITGQVLTGIALGTASSGYHEIFDALSGIAKSSHASADEKKKTAE